MGKLRERRAWFDDEYLVGGAGRERDDEDDGKCFCGQTAVITRENNDEDYHWTTKGSYDKRYRQL